MSTLPPKEFVENHIGPPTLASWREFFDIQWLSIPVSCLDMTTRLNENLIHFQLNYLNVVLIIYVIALFRPIVISGKFPFIFFFVASHAPIWCAIPYVNPRISPRQLQVFGFVFVVDRCFYLIMVLVATVLPFAIAQAWIYLFVFLVSSAAIVSLHAMFRVPSFEYEAPSEPKLEVDEAV